MADLQEIRGQVDSAITLAQIFNADHTVIAALLGDLRLIRTGLSLLAKEQAAAASKAAEAKKADEAAEARYQLARTMSFPW